MRITPTSFFPQWFHTLPNYLNLDEFYQAKRVHIPNPKNPSQIQKALAFYNRDRVTWGGWGEDRSNIWADTYLKASGKFVHLGVDLNERRATPVYCPFDCKVVDIFTDTDTKIGWGGRIILERNGLYLVVGHLEPASLTTRKSLKRGNSLGDVGTWPTNGNTFEHIHIQVIKKFDGEEFDGYGYKRELKDNPNPFGVEF